MFRTILSKQSQTLRSLLPLQSRLYSAEHTVGKMAASAMLGVTHDKKHKVTVVGSGNW